MRTETMTLASALDVLAKTTKTEDGVFNAVIAEAAQRLREQEWEIAALTVQLRTNHERAEEIIAAREATIARLSPNKEAEPLRADESQS